VDVLFLDANVLFSAAYRADAGIAWLWDFDDVELVTSDYAADEARRNLAEPHQKNRLDDLLRRTRVESGGVAYGIPDDLVLAEKDRPILAAAISAGATHLVTGDVNHFGALFGRDIAGVRILPPGRYFRERGEATKRCSLQAESDAPAPPGDDSGGPTR
jgi:predicted nucleic acid-binding protein